EEEEEESRRESETVRKIARKLEALPRSRARFVASFAYVLGRVAYADHDVSDEETRAMEELVREEVELPPDQATLVVEIAKTQNRLFGGTENFLVTREFREVATDEERRALLEALFAVSAADDIITGIEEASIRQIASELGFRRSEFVEARSRWSEKRSVMKSLRSEEE
ncbi:MAG: TerB family tellurite resistance protein, partial [Thermoanaerobaculia bacterium]|nr:TerB family tellurite resistance protein [Thermoanaerobaculia bacterium]